MVAALVVLAGLASCGGAAPQPGALERHERAKALVELVESAPVETTLGSAELRDAAEVWLELVRGARRTIDAAHFYASNAPGSRLEPVVAAMEVALAQGVRVRFLAEKKFATVYPDTLARLAKAGAEVRLFDQSGSTGGVLHAKSFVVDDEVGFLGSQNFDWRALEHIYELGALVREPAVVRGMRAVFELDWASAAGATLPAASAASATLPAASAAGAQVSLVASPRDRLPPGVAWELPRLVALIDGATRTVRMQALGYGAHDRDGAWDELAAPLLRAAARGVKVQLLLADWALRPRSLGDLQRLLAGPHGGHLEVRIVRVPPWSGGFLPYARVIHAKVLVADGARGYLGTSNWEKSYFYRSRNLGLVLDEPQLGAQLERFFLRAWDSPYAFTLDPAAQYEAPRIE